MPKSSRTPIILKTEAQSTEWLLGLIDYERRPPSGAEPTRFFHLDRFDALLSSLGAPQNQFPAVHVAGTSGKGWICSALASICMAAGFKTGLYLSPHLRSFRERIRVDNELISEKDFAAGLSDLGPKFGASEADGGFRTVFEILTALAFQTFAREKVDIAIIETGLGGRLDCTAVIHPRLSIIANIGWDHMAILGNTITAIAHEKAGILKPGTPVVVSEQTKDVRAEAMAEIKRSAAEKNAPLIEAAKRVRVQTVRETLTGATHHATLSGKPLEIRWRGFGPAAELNLKTILAAVEQLRLQGFAIPDKAIRQGLAQWRWPGRLELLARRPVILVDGGHNTSSAKAVREALNRVAPGQPIHWVIAMLRDKDIRSVLQLLLGPHDTVIAAPAPPSRGAAAKDIALAALDCCPRVDARPTLEEAIALAIKLAGPQGIVAIAGSLYIVAPAQDAVEQLGFRLPGSRA